MTSSKYAVREWERRFLLAGVPEGLGVGRLIEDTYLPDTGLRFRRLTEADGSVVLKLGQKVPSSPGLLHTTLYLSPAEWARLWRPGHALRKRRHVVGDVAVDVFEGALVGLVLAEVDLGDGPDRPSLLEDLVALGLPVVREVTDDSSYDGGALAASRPATEPVSDVVVRPYDEDDWPIVRGLIEDVAVAGSTYSLETGLDDDALRAFWLSDPFTVVAEIDGVVAGTAHGGPNRPAQGSHIGTGSFIVAERARGRGVGRVLGGALIDWHRLNGFRGIQFNAVVSTNEAAVALWTSLGFDTIGVVPGAFQLPNGSYADLLVMFLSLEAPS